jgi:WhiB family redox-sensing transcriptional regulator
MSESWRQKAACIGEDTEYWFSTDTGITPAMRRALTICRSCEVQLACLQYAVDQPEYFGIWGGMTTKQRHRITRTPKGAA